MWTSMHAHMHTCLGLTARDQLYSVKTHLPGLTRTTDRHLPELLYLAHTCSLVHTPVHMLTVDILYVSC